MNARKFIAANSREALKLVRVELGPDAIILSNRKVPEGVEIVAMANAELEHISTTRLQETRLIDPAVAANREKVLNQAAVLGAKILTPVGGNQPAMSAKSEMVKAATVHAPAAQATLQSAAKSAASEEQSGLLNELKSMRSLLQEQLSTLAWSDKQQRDPRRTSLIRDMINVGFSPALSRQLLEKMPQDADQICVRRILAHNIRVVAKNDDIVTRGGVYALVGPTGVGKTTTTAKLAARAVVRYGADKVALITTDSYRIGAHEQLKIYGKILGVAVHAVRDTEDLRLTLSGLKHKHLVLIDTMGVGQRDSRVATQSEMFEACGVQRILLLNATSSGGTLDDVVRMYRGNGVIGCIPTKLDEAVTLGTVLDVAVRHKLALHYIASGQRVPEDLHEVNIDYLLDRAFRAISKQSPFVMQELEFPSLMAGVQVSKVTRREYAPA